METYASYEPGDMEENGQEKGERFSLDNQERSYAARLERMMEEEFPLEKVQNMWNTYDVIHRGNRGFPDRYKEIKKDFKLYKKYMKKEINENPIKSKKDL